MRLSGTQARSISSSRGLGNTLWDLAGNRPSLDLPFSDTKSLVDTTTGKTLVDFTRASSGTYVGSDGLIKTATTNLLLRSEEFDSAYWTTGGGPVTPNATTAPDGALTADLYTTTGAAQSIYPLAGTTVSPSTSYTFSVYVKLGTMAVSNYRIAFYDVTNAAFIAVDVVPAQVPTTDAWTRVVYTLTTPAGCTTLRAYPFRSGATIPSSTVYLWGAQLEQSSTVGEYIRTTSTINSAPRFDHDPTTGESLGLLREESRINRFQWSNSAVNGETWNNVGALLDLQAGATDPAGGANAFVASDATNLNTGTFLQRLSVDATLPANTVVTYSVWIKPISTPNDVVILNLFANGVTDSLAALFTNTNGVLNFGSSVVTGTAVLGGASVVPYPNGWYRLVLTGIPSTTAGSDMRARINLGSYQQVQGTPRFYWYGAQLETGLASSPAAPFVTSYIPTIGSTVTRAADVASIGGINFSSWYRQDEGTLYVKAVSSISSAIVTADSNSLVSRKPQISVGSFSEVTSNYVESGTVLASLNTEITSATFSHATAYADNDYAAARDGGNLAIDTSGALPGFVTTLRLGRLSNGAAPMNGTIRRITYWPTRLPNETLQTITQ